MAAERVGIGLVGCGFISEIYLKNLATYDGVEVVACADAMPERARARAEQFGIAKAVPVPELLADPAVDLVLNLTIPVAHAEVALAAVAAGKSVYGEKPLTIAREDGRRLLDEAGARGVRVGSAPDTFLGAGLQTCRALLDGGAIGEPVAATAFMLGHGPEGWHPDPAFYYQVGGGPLFDMGPYYLTALVSMLGPVRRVTGSARASFPERTIGSQPKAGEKIPVEVATHVAAVLDFAGGTVATLVTSFDVWASEAPKLELYGAAGSMSLPDPNTFGGPVRLRSAGEEGWTDVPVTRPYAANSRGVGPADMAIALRAGRPHRASGELAFHVLDVMHAIEEASASGRHVEITSTCERPAPLPAGLAEGELDR
ncbi:MAG: Dehydrogenase [uncultured Thermomicrobiales bacterium]|uniref:Dehydrogenase n=1 Tax=uncultured Thermomicrobiales bacterium TaxID=1645740 RepID=A0A6J4UWA7_9BACT|nr:MAG: Dehydrogenase [uncultured Thermomicrobiales bacterium]